MPEQDENKPYIDAIANLRETAKWIVSSAAALAVLILGGTSLNGIGSLDPGFRLYLAIGSALVSVVLAGVIMAMAVRVMTATAGINFDLLRTARRYRRHRRYLEGFVLNSLPDGFRTLNDMQGSYDAARVAMLAGAHGPPDDRLRLQGEFQVCHRYVMLTVNAGKWVDVTYRFKAMMRVFIVAAVLILVFIYGFIWAANPSKEVGNALEQPLSEMVQFPDAQLAALEAARFPVNCVRPALHLLIYKERPANIVEAYTLPDKTVPPSVTCPIRKLVYDTKSLTILKVQ